MGNGQQEARSGGVTLIELMIYLAVIAILGVPMIMIVVSVTRSAAEGDMLSKVNERNRTALQRIASEYRGSLSGTTVISDGGKTLQFTTSGGFNGAGPVAGSVIRYAILPANGEAINGVDDNQNGLIDEGILVREDQTMGLKTILTNTMNAASSIFIANGNGITANINTFGRTQGAKAVTNVRRSITIFPRN